MNKDQAFQTIDESEDILRDFEDNEKELAEALENTYNIIRELETEIAELNHQWISVNDRLPPIRESVLYLLHDYDMDIGVYSRTKKEWRVDSTDDYYWNKEDVTHWMPLPEPPDKKMDVYTKDASARERR